MRFYDLHGVELNDGCVVRLSRYSKNYYVFHPANKNLKPLTNHERISLDILKYSRFRLSVIRAFKSEKAFQEAIRCENM